MGFYEYTTYLKGHTIVPWTPDHVATTEETGYRIGLREYDDPLSWLDCFDMFLQSGAADHTQALVVGIWSYDGEASDDVVAALVAARERLPQLEALFIGDILQEENEVSWIIQTDMASLWTAFPRLKHFYVRGGNGLRFGYIQHAQLETLVVQTGGLGREVVAEIFASSLPQLVQLELWLGDENYGATVSVADLEPLLQATILPQLKYLGLKNSAISDDIALALQGATILERIEVLDLSQGTLSDLGGQALLDNPAVHRLTFLNLYHHYLSDELVAQFRLLQDVQVDVGAQQAADVWNDELHRYVAVSE